MTKLPLSSRLRLGLYLVTAVILTCFASSAQAPAAQTDADSLGRSTPRGAVKGFLHAADDNNYALAAQYLESSHNPQLAEELKAVLDAALQVNLNDISDDPAGRIEDALPIDRERIGTVRVGGTSLEIVLHRVNLAGTGQVWRFAPETLRGIPGLYEDLAPSWVERFVPEALRHREMLGVELWRLLGLFIVIPVTVGVAWLIGMVLLVITRSFARRAPAAWNDSMVAILRGPLRLFLTVLLFHVGVLFLGLPLLFRQWLTQLELAVGVFAVAWFSLRLIDLASAETRQVLIRTQRTAAVAMVPLGRRIVKVLAVSLAVLAVLDNAGFDLRAVLTGLGVGGIAVALAAQKTLENIFGGMAIVADQPVRVGDFCKFGDNVGTVEDVGLRSTRIRTLDRTVIAVPNASFSTISLENFAPRDKMFLHPTLALRMDSSTAQVRQVLDGVQKLLDQHPKVESRGKIRFAGFGTNSLNLEVFCYVTTPDWNEFEVLRQGLLLSMLEVIEAAGTSLALPARTTFLARDRGIHRTSDES
jgi:MscS family membrane protein